MEMGNNFSLEIQGYAQDALDEGLRSYLQDSLTGNLRLIQSRAYEDWKSWLADLGTERLLQRGDVQRVFSIFDGYFFAGCLSTHTDVFWTVRRKELGLSRLLGSCAIIDGRAQILLSKSHRGMRCRSRIQEVLATLLHEMFHAFLGLFGCLCKSCYKKVASTIGLSGHGPAWVFAAVLVERHADEFFRVADLPFDIGLEEGLKREREEVEKVSRCHCSDN